jgi:hypothetical protein
MQRLLRSSFCVARGYLMLIDQVIIQILEELRIRVITGHVLV